MTITRFDMRLDEEIKLKAEKVCALLGIKSLTEYVVKLMDQDATKVIAEHESIILEDDIFDRFMDACDKLKEPNTALLNAVAYSKEQDIK